MKRLTIIKEQLISNLTSNKNKNIKENNNIKQFSDINPFKSYLTKEELNYLTDFKNFLESKLKDKLFHLHESETVPIDIYREIALKFPESLNGMLSDNNNLIKNHCSKYLNFAINVEIGKFEPSLLGVFLVHGRLNLGLILKFCNEEQKKRLIPDMLNLNLITSFCLTEKDIGSEAHNLKTTFEEIKPKNNNEESYFIINGNKRWIGNADMADYLIVFAKNKENPNNISAFLIEKNSSGLDIDIIQSKISLQIVHNCNIKFNNVKVKKLNHISNIKSFKDVSECLVESRLYLCIVGLGLLIGEFEKIVKYTNERKQFGKSINSFQLVQYKLAVIYSKVEAVSAYLERLVEITYNEDGSKDLSQGLVSMSKYWVGETVREALRLSRELYGGNGILFNNGIKALAEIEALNIVEGTTDINVLAAGKLLTKISAYYR